MQASMRGVIDASNSYDPPLAAKGVVRILIRCRTGQNGSGAIFSAFALSENAIFGHLLFVTA